MLYDDEIMTGVVGQGAVGALRVCWLGARGIRWAFVLVGNRKREEEYPWLCVYECMWLCVWRDMINVGLRLAVSLGSISWLVGQRGVLLKNECPPCGMDLHHGMIYRHLCPTQGSHKDSKLFCTHLSHSPPVYRVNCLPSRIRIVAGSLGNLCDEPCSPCGGWTDACVPDESARSLAWPPEMPALALSLI
jgi:hypothetical protein